MVLRRQFYEATLHQPHPKDIADTMDFVERRLGSVAAVRGTDSPTIATELMRVRSCLHTRRLQP